MTYAACSLALIAAGTDLWSRRIPNLLVLAGLFTGFFIAVLTAGLEGLTFALMGAAAGFSLLLLPYLLGGMGGGDVKLMMALGAILGPISIFWVFIYACLVGGLMALAVIIISRRWQVIVANRLMQFGIVIPYPQRFPAPNQAIPYGVAIAAGVVIFLLQGVI